MPDQADDPPEADPTSEFTAPEKTPFSFKLMVGFGVLYLGWRAIELALCAGEWIGWGNLGADWCS